MSGGVHRGTREGRALGFSAANTTLSKLAGLVVGIALARLLGPSEFGTYAVAFVALMVVLSLNDLGVSLAIVRWPDDPRRIAPTVASLSVLSSAVLALGLAAAAGAFARLMGAPGAAPAVRLLALCVLVNGIVATAAALLQRDLRQDLRLVVDQVNLWLGAVVALVLAAVGTGATSLAVGRVTGAVVSGVLLLGFSPLPLRFGWDPALLRRLLRFGLPLAGASAVVVGIGFVDQLLVGHHVGPASLGAYVLAANLAGWPVHLLSGPLRQVTPPLFARRRHDPPAARAALGSVARALLALAVPCCVALAACAGPVVHLLYGEEWVAAAGPLRWLALGALVRIVAELLYDYLVVVGRTSWLLAVQVAWLVALAPAVAVGLRIDGISGAAAATAVVGLLVVLPSYALALRAVRTPVRPLLGAVVLPGAAGLAVVVAVRLPGVAGGPDLLVLGVAAAATALAWSLLVARGHLRMPAEVPPGLPPGLPAGMPAEAPRPAATAEATP